MIEISNLYKMFERRRPEDRYALMDINIEIGDGEFVYLVGPSGSGKTTLMKILNREQLPTKGDVFVDGENLSKIKRNQIPYYRRKLGVIFQDFKLLYNKTAVENMVMAMRAQGKIVKGSLEQVRDILKLIGISAKMDFLTDELSRGEQRLLTIARALATSPKFILADEPLVDLNKSDQKKILDIFEGFCKRGSTVIIATKQIEYAKLCHSRIVKIISGRIKED